MDGVAAVLMGLAVFALWNSDVDSPSESIQSIPSSVKCAERHHLTLSARGLFDEELRDAQRKVSDIETRSLLTQGSGQIRHSYIPSVNYLTFDKEADSREIFQESSSFVAWAENGEIRFINNGVDVNIKDIFQFADDESIQKPDYENIGQSGEDRSDDHSDPPHIPINENIISLSQHDQTGGFQDDDSNYGSSVSTDQRMSRSSSFSDFVTESLEDKSGYSHITKRTGGREYHINYPLTTILDNSRDDNCEETMDESGYDSVSDSSEGEIELKRDGPQVQGEPIEQDSADEECDKTDIMSVWSNKNQLVDSDLDNIITSNECQSNPSSIDDMAISRINIIDHDEGDSISEELVDRHLISIHLIDQSPVMINEQVRSVDGVDNGEDQEVTSSDNVLKADPISIDNGDSIPDHVDSDSSSIISTKPDHQLPVQQELIRHHSSEQLSDNDYDWPSSTFNDKEQRDRNEDGRTSDIEYEGTKNDDEDVQGGVCEVDDQTDDDNQVVIEEMELSPFIISPQEVSGQLFDSDSETSNDEEKSDKGDGGRRSNIEYEGEMRYSQIDDEDGQADDNGVDCHAGDSEIVSGIMGSPSLCLPRTSQQELPGQLSDSDSEGPSGSVEEESDRGVGDRRSEFEYEGEMRYWSINKQNGRVGNGEVDGPAGDSEIVSGMMELPTVSLPETNLQELSTQSAFNHQSDPSLAAKDHHQNDISTRTSSKPSVESAPEYLQSDKLLTVDHPLILNIESGSPSGRSADPSNCFTYQVDHIDDNQLAHGISFDQSVGDNQTLDMSSDDRIQEEQAISGSNDDGDLIISQLAQVTSFKERKTLLNLLNLTRAQEGLQEIDLQSLLKHDALEDDRQEKDQLEQNQLENDRQEKHQLEQDQSKNDRQEKVQLEQDQLKNDQQEKNRSEHARVEVDRRDKKTRFGRPKSWRRSINKLLSRARCKLNTVL